MATNIILTEDPMDIDDHVPCLDGSTEQVDIETQNSDDELLAAASENVINECRSDIRRFLHLRAILPKLKDEGLVARDGKEELKPPPPLTYDETNEIDKLIAWFPSSGDPQYLRKLIVCLREPDKGGDLLLPHEELANILEKALEDELANPKPKKAAAVTIEETGGGVPSNAAIVRQMFFGRDRGPCQKHCSIRWVTCYTMTVFLALLASISVVVLIVHPSRTISHLSPSILHLKDVAELKFSLDPFWISHGTLSFDKDTCAGSGDVHVIRGQSCDQLNITATKTIDKNNLGNGLRFFYLLKGSTINILNVNTMDPEAENLVFWITSSSEAFSIIDNHRRDNTELYNNLCTSPNPFPNAYCYIASEHVGQDITFHVNESGYYHLYDGITVCFDIPCYSWAVNSVHYDLSLLPNSTSQEDHSIFSTVASELEGLIEFTIMEDWMFSNQNCVLIRSNCTATNSDELSADLSSPSVIRRVDVILFPALGVILAALIACSVVFVHCVYRSRQQAG